MEWRSQKCIWLYKVFRVCLENIVEGAHLNDNLVRAFFKNIKTKGIHLRGTQFSEKSVHFIQFTTLTTVSEWMSGVLRDGR